MPRPTTLKHPVAQLRVVADLKRNVLAGWMGIATVTLEKVERGERRLSALHIERIFRATGVCPGWLTNPTDPMHTADGYPFTRDEYIRWRNWMEGSSLPRRSGPEPSVPIPDGGFGYALRRTGPNHAACCPDQRRLSLISPPDSKLSAAERRIAEKVSRTADLQRLKHDLVDLARGVAVQAGSDTQVLLEALHALRKLCPKARITPDPRDVEEVKALGIGEGWPPNASRDG